MHVLIEQYLAQHNSAITSGNRDTPARIPVDVGKAEDNRHGASARVGVSLSHADRDHGKTIRVSACDRRAVSCQILLGQDVHHHFLLQGARCGRECRYQASSSYTSTFKYFRFL